MTDVDVAWYELSPREQQVSAYCRQGYSYPQIADRLGLDLDAVQKYAAKAIHKFGALNKTEMCLLLSGWNFDNFIESVWNNPVPNQSIEPPWHRKALPCP